MTRARIEQMIINAILLSGVVLSIIQFVYNRSLWVDEAKLALNIISRNNFELLKPLDAIQIAPVLFLQIEKIFSLLIPNSEYGLRLFPLFCYWGALFFFYKLIKLTFNRTSTIILALSLFVFNSILIYYSNEVKQYMTDVLIITSTYYFVLKSYSDERNKYYLLAFWGAISIFLSSVTPIVLFTVGVYLLYDYWINKKQLTSLITISIVWVAAFLIYYFLFVSGHPSLDSQKEAFAIYFMPTNPMHIDFYKFLYGIFRITFISLLPFQIHNIYFLAILFFIGGIALLNKKKRSLLLLIAMPILLNLLLSALKLYPVKTRLVLYTCPIFILIISSGFDYIVNLLSTKYKLERLRLSLIILPLLCGYLFYKNGFPERHEEIKESINYIQQHIAKTDKMYVYNSASIAYKYYTEIKYSTISQPVIWGTMNRDNKEKYMEEMKDLKGRNWLLFTHVFGDEETYIVSHLDSLGYKKLSSFQTTGSSAYLYDFGL